LETYNPLFEPDKREWLGLSELDRIDVVREFHENSDEAVELEDEALFLHSSIHVIVENQIAMGVELLPETIAKLIRQGLDRHEAIHAIGAIISEDIYYIARGEQKEFSPKQYRSKLKKITAKRWKKGQY
jgi:hypothetical protein